MTRFPLEVLRSRAELNSGRMLAKDRLSEIMNYYCQIMALKAPIDTKTGEMKPDAGPRGLQRGCGLCAACGYPADRI